MVQLVIDNLRMQFGERLLFEAPHLCFAKGDVIYLQGDNGTGKTTLMKLLAGLIQPSAGQIRWQDDKTHPWWKIHPQLGKAVYLHQHPYLYEGTVKYNLGFAGRYSQLSRRELSHRMEQAADMAGLTHLLTASAVNLSGGERQRLAVARAWVIQPDLLMLDEPVSNMDKESRRLMLEMISTLKQQGTGMLISSHQTCGLTALCRHTWQIEHQHITAAPFYPDTTQPYEESIYVVTN